MIANSQQGRRCLRQTSWSFFLERASTSNFCCATDQNKPHILKYVSYDRSCLLQPCGKLFSWAPPVPLGNFYPLAPHPLGISINHPCGGGIWIFSGISQYWCSALPIELVSQLVAGHWVRLLYIYSVYYEIIYWNLCIGIAGWRISERQSSLF